MYKLQSNKWGRGSKFILKINKTKAYDRVECDYLQSLMLQMGFNLHWVHLIR